MYFVLICGQCILLHLNFFLFRVSIKLGCLFLTYCVFLFGDNLQKLDFYFSCEVKNLLFEINFLRAIALPNFETQIMSNPGITSWNSGTCVAKNF